MTFICILRDSMEFLNKEKVIVWFPFFDRSNKWWLAINIHARDWKHPHNHESYKENHLKSSSYNITGFQIAPQRGLSWQQNSKQDLAILKAFLVKQFDQAINRQTEDFNNTPQKCSTNFVTPMASKLHNVIPYSHY